METKESPALITTFESKEGTVKIYNNGFLETYINEGAYLDAAYIIEGKKKLEELGLGKKFYVLNEAAGFYRASRDARKLSASKEYAEHLGAIAVMVNHVSVRFILDLYLNIDKPHTPTKAFTDRKLALKWLRKKMSEAK
jgi:hypothetical protein